MRIFKNFNEALNEIKRDLSEMGVVVHPQTMQDKYVADNPDYQTKELQNYIYTVTNPTESIHQLKPSQPWADFEFYERIDESAHPLNPGMAWTARKEVWTEFLHQGKFAYTYNERYHTSDQLRRLAREIIEHPDSRQLYLAMWDVEKDIPKLGGSGRVPCSLGYLFQKRGGKLNMTYMMRSCDFITHFQNDAFLSVRLLEHMAILSGTQAGNFTHFMGSLHVYSKDVKGVF
jgi:thymidylate synthase